MLVDVWVTALLAFLFDAVAAPGVFFVRVERCLPLPDPGSCCCCELLVAELFEVADISSCLLEPRPRLKLLPNTLDIQADDLLEAVQVNRELLLRKKLRPVLREFDVVVIDTPPAMRAATLNGLAVADTIVIPVDSSSFALLGLTQLLQVIAAIREAHKPDIVIRPLSTMFSRRQNFGQADPSAGRAVFRSRSRPSNSHPQECGHSSGGSHSKGSGRVFLDCSGIL
jgi:AAA domain